MNDRLTPVEQRLIDELRALTTELDACRRDLAEERREHGPDEDCEVCELDGELAEERTLHQATLRDLAEERARTTRLTEALTRMPDAGLREGDPRYAWWNEMAAPALRFARAGTEQPA